MHLDTRSSCIVCDWQHGRQADVHVLDCHHRHCVITHNGSSGSTDDAVRGMRMWGGHSDSCRAGD